MTAHAQIATDKSSRYLQALCGHFMRKVQATYTAEAGEAQFGFGVARLWAAPSTLWLEVCADDDKGFTRIKDVVGGHLERFAEKDRLTVTWQEGQAPDLAAMVSEVSA